MVAVLAAAKLGVLAYMNVTLNGPAAKSVAVAPVQQPGPVPILQQARNAVLEENRALAAQPALAAEPVKDKAKEKEKAPDKAEPVISVQALKQRSEQLDRQEQALRSLEADLNTRTAKLAQLETTIKAMIDHACKRISARVSSTSPSISRAAARGSLAWRMGRPTTR